MGCLLIRYSNAVLVMLNPEYNRVITKVRVGDTKENSLQMQAVFSSAV